MIPKECKRLAEVDFPIAVVSQHSAKEKYGGKGHPNTLHLWWARRPLAACRAILMALLLPDPCDSACPEEFKQRARNILPRVQGHVDESDADLRAQLLRFIRDFAGWKNSSNLAYLDAARGLMHSAYGDELPMVVDSFAGGGSIPLEALRIGCDAFASDLNPVACLVLKTMLEDIPRHLHSDVADQLCKVGADIRAEVERELGEFYRPDHDGATPIAYLWARSITCDTCGAEIPLVRSFWLSNKAGRKRALRYSVQRNGKEPPRLLLEVFEPKKDSDVPPGTTTRAKASCPCCNITMNPDRVRTQLATQTGGCDVIFDDTGKRMGGACLLAVVTSKRGESGRRFRLASERDYSAVWRASRLLKDFSNTSQSEHFSPIPDEALPPIGTLGFRVQRYGILKWGDLFTARQKLVLLSLCKRVRSHQSPLAELLALAFDRVAMSGMSLTRWNPSAEKMQHTFGRQALPIVWSFAEVAPLSDAPGNWESGYQLIADVINAFPDGLKKGNVQLADASQLPLVSDDAGVWFTDPPYYDAIPYADLSDFFFVWLKRLLPSSRMLRDPFDSQNPLTPKQQEAVQDDTKSVNGRKKDRAFFEDSMATAFAEGRRVLSDDGVGCVVFAHKSTEGWEALLSGLIRGGWVITASWPIVTEMETRQRARESAALAASVHLVCRPRQQDASVGDWADVLSELPRRVGDWIERLQDEGIRGADLVFSCIGPAMEIYSRFRRVEDAEGREIPLGGDATASEPYKRGFLAYVWETVGRLALEQVLGTAEARARNGAAGALEEDSRLTALFLWTLQATETAGNGDTANEDEEHEDQGTDEEEKPTKKKSGYTLIYDVARRFAQPLGIHLDKWEGRIIETEKGVVRLLPVAERAMQLFGDADVSAISRRIEQDVKASRNYTFAFMQDVAAAPEIRPRGRRKTVAAGATIEEPPAVQTVTTLDRVHAAMLLQASGQANGLRAMLKEEQQRGPDFLRLANALSALYPKDSEEKRLLDAMLLAVPRS
jgi:adenine-specific DNA methylase